MPIISGSAATKADNPLSGLNNFFPGYRHLPFFPIHQGPLSAVGISKFISFE
jgi:hypothetical protein